MTDLHSRGARIFGTTSGEVRWPYGLNDQLCWYDRKTDPEGWEAQRDLTARQRFTIVEWAERYGLRESASGCCERWLARERSRRCSGCGNAKWIDHGTWWLKDGKPAAVTGAPYGFFGDEMPDVLSWLAADDRLQFTIGAGWYGHGTVQTVLWRADRIENLRPAVLYGSFPNDVPKPGTSSTENGATP